jgi:hypothetical protein
MSVPEESVTPWALRSTLIAVSELERSVAFYRELGPFDEIARNDAVAILGEKPPPSMVLILRERRSTHATRHGQQSLGLRAITFNVGSPAELDRVESVLRDRGLFTSRRTVENVPSDLVLGRDPDNLPLGFVCYPDGADLGSDYYDSVADLVYSMDT